MKKIMSLLLCAAMMVSTFAVVNAEETTPDTSTETTYESVLLSQGKPVEAGIIDGESHSDTSTFSSAEVMVDGVTTTTTQSKMWYEHSSVDGKMIYLNLDLQDAYTITKIDWRGRYAPETYKNSSVYDWWNMKIYGANEADFSDKKLIYTTGGTEYIQTPEFVIAAEDIAEYRYIRFEKDTAMGGQELYVYGYKNPASNANLSALSVEGYSLDSEFSAIDTEYTVEANILPGTTSVTVSAVAESETATISGAGEVEVTAGVNTIPVTVTSENGTTKTYTIKLVVVETQLLSLNKSVTAAIDGTGGVKSESFGTVDLMVNGAIKNNNTSTMWYLISDNASDNVCLDVDLEAAYMITKIKWVGRYAPSVYANSAKYDWHNMTIYGANEADYSDKKVIYETGSASTERDVEFVLQRADIANYRYIRFEKKQSMGGQELYVYGYDASNADLSALSVDGYSMDSEFSADDTEYTIVASAMPVDNTITINAEAALATSEITGTGTVTVDKYGSNTIPVTVTTKNGATKTYTINFVVGEATLLSLNKPVTTAIDGTGSEKSDSFGTVDLMVNGAIKNNNTSTMWYLISDNASDNVCLDVDLEAAYMITKIKWVGRYAPNVYANSAKYDWHNMTIYGANEADYSDKKVIYETGSASTERDVEFVLQTADIANYRYIRFEKKQSMGGQELYVYGLPGVSQTTEDTTTIVTVPSHNYAVGDRVLAIVYNADGTLKSVVPVDAQNAPSTAVELTKAAGETAKVVVWNSYAGMQPRMDVYDVQ